MLPQLFTMGPLLPFHFFKLSFFTKSALRLLFTVNKVTQHKDRAIRAKSARQRCQNTTVTVCPLESQLQPGGEILWRVINWKTWQDGQWLEAGKPPLKGSYMLALFLPSSQSSKSTNAKIRLDGPFIWPTVLARTLSHHPIAIKLNTVLFLRSLPWYNPSNTSVRTLPPASATYTDIRGGELITGTVGCFNYSETNWKTSLNTNPESAAVLGVQLQGANAANNWVMTGIPGVEMAKLWSHLQVNASNIAKCRAKEQGHSLH